MTTHEIHLPLADVSQAPSGPRDRSAVADDHRSLSHLEDLAPCPVSISSWSIVVQGCFDCSVACFGDLPRMWCVAWLTGTAGATMTPRMQDIVDCMNGDMVRNLLGLLIAMPLTMGIPPAFKEKRIMSHFLTHRLVKLGRLQKVQCSLTANSECKDKTGSAYQITFHGGMRRVRLEHIDGDYVDIPARCPVSPIWTVRNPHCDQTAYIECPLGRYVLRSFFPKGTGPHKVFLPETLLAGIAQDWSMPSEEARLPSTPPPGIIGGEVLAPGPNDDGEECTSGTLPAVGASHPKRRRMS